MHPVYSYLHGVWVPHACRQPIKEPHACANGWFGVLQQPAQVRPSSQHFAAGPALDALDALALGCAITADALGAVPAGTTVLADAVADMAVVDAFVV
jgi:hypothetical protein